MEKQVKVVVSKKEPQNKHVLWLEQDPLHEISPKLYNNGEWQNLKTVNAPEELLDKVGKLNDSVKEFDREVENFNSDITSFRNSLITETQQRMAVDSSLGNRITSVTTTANNNKTSLDNLEATLNTNLENLRAKDAELEEAISNEVTSRRNEVDSLQVSISNVGNRVSMTESKIISLQGNVSTLQSEVSNVKNDVVPKAVAEGIASVVANAPETLDTLKEVADYIASDKTKASEIEVAISNLQKADKEITDVLDALVVNDLTTGGADKALSAEMGKELAWKVTESDGGRDFIVKEVDNTSSIYILYNKVIPKSKAVRFELQTKTAVLNSLGKNNPVDLRLTLSDSSTLTVKDFYFNDKPYTYFSENLYITKIICGSGKNESEQNGTVELKVSIGEYAEKMYFREKVSEDISIAIPIYKIVDSRYINKQGIVTTVSGQPYLCVYIYDISEYVGKTLKINGYYPISGNTYYLWSISSSDTFDNPENILAHSYKHRVSLASTNEYDEYHSRDIIYVQPNYRYLAVAINTEEIQGKLYGCFELMNEQESISYLQKSTSYLQENLDKAAEKVDKNEEKIQQIVNTIDAGFDTDIIYWGHSLVVGDQDGKGVNIENTVQSIIGGTFINAGIGGEETNDYAFRQGGATLVIPAGSINGTYNKLYDTFDAPLAYLGGQTDIGNTINPLVLSNGKTCSITRQNGNWLISGYDGPTTAYPLEARSKGSLYKGKILVLWPGANGTALSQNTDRPFSQLTQAQEMYVDSMIAHHGTDKYVIIGYTGTTTEQDPASYWDLMASLNLKYGNKFINARQKLCEYGLAINGLTPNEHVAKIYNDGIQERTLLNVISVSEIKSGTIHVEMTDGGESVISVDGNGVNIPRTTSYSLNGTTLTYTSSYRVSVENELTQVAGKHLPSRLVYDTVHLSHYGYFALGTIIAHRMIALGYDKLIGD